jgi:uncharacterized phage protein (TIGR01671 family)
MNNRVFKFRLWNIEDKFWDNPALLEVWDNSGVLKHLYDHNDEKSVVQQFTGLLDKNGKEIYEGDILSEHWKHDGSNHTSIVRFGIFQNDANQIYGNGYYLDYPRESYMSGRPLISSGYKIIGNIFENSELLK